MRIEKDAWLEATPPCAVCGGRGIEPRAQLHLPFGVSVWLWRTGRPVWFALLPAVVMVASTGAALVLNFRGFYAQFLPKHDGAALTNMVIAAVLFLLGALVVFEAVRVWLRARAEDRAAMAFAAVPATE